MYSFEGKRLSPFVTFEELPELSSQNKYATGNWWDKPTKTD